jgi:3-hydroxyisobutyrate dehydrogenase-like beta-hydroxyacid dehydrogenase
MQWRQRGRPPGRFIVQCSVGWVGTREKAADLLAKGAVWAATPRETASGSDVTFTMVGFPSDVEQVTLGPDGVLARMSGI